MKKRRTLTVFVMAAAICMAAGVLSRADTGKKEQAVKKKMKKLGFEVGLVKSRDDGSFVVKLMGFTAKTKGLTMKGEYKPFKAKALLVKGILFLDRGQLKKRGFSLQAGMLPPGIRIIDFKGIKGSENKALELLFMTQPRVKKIKNLIATAKKKKAEAQKVIPKIKKQVKAARAALNKCPALEAGATGKELSYFTFLYATVELKGAGTRCEGYELDLNNIGVDIREASEGVGGVLTAIRKHQNYVQKQCSSKGLSEEDRNTLKEDLEGVVELAEEIAADLDKAIGKLEMLVDSCRTWVEKKYGDEQSNDPT